MKYTSQIPTWLFLVLIVTCVFLSTIMLRKQEISFSSDIARDFHLLREVDEKKLILIGPRSSVGGLFHGPLWIYLNYPAFKLGGGDPIVVGWGWIVLCCLFIVSCYTIIRSLFTPLAGQLAALMVAVYMAYTSQSLFNPHGAMFLIPFFFYTAVRYMQTKKATFLVLHMLTTGVIIQFQMAIGIPLLMLTILFHAYYIWKFKTFSHLTIFALILIPLSTFIVFDMRHEHLLIHSALRHIQSGNASESFLSLMLDRVNNLITGIEFVRSGGAFWNTVVFCISFIMIVMQCKSTKYGNIYKAFIFYFFGFYILSLINKFPLLYFYTFPIFPLAFVMFASLITSSYKYVFVVIYTLVLVANIYGLKQHVAIQSANMKTGEDSWKTYDDVALALANVPEKTYGYFVYSPDTLAYQAKYAVFYETEKSKKEAMSFKKMPVMYLVIAPPPANNPLMGDAWWKENKLHLSKKPDSITNFTSGYKLEKYTLTPEEIAVPFDPQIDPGIFFR